MIWIFISGLSGFFNPVYVVNPVMTYLYRTVTGKTGFYMKSGFFKFESTFINLLNYCLQDTYYYLLRRYLESVCSSGCETRRVYLNLIGKLQDLHRLNESHIQVFLEVNPKLVGPLLIEIFDLKSANTCNNQTPPSVKP